MAYEDIKHTTQVGPVTVVTKLVQDDDCENPMESYDGQGSLKLFERHSWDGNTSIHETYKDDPMALPLEAYIHSGTVYALKSEGNFPDRQWDVAALAGYWVCDGYALENYQESIKDKTPEEAKEILKAYARGVLEEYNNWLAGDCWGVLTDFIDDQGNEFAEQDACWGFIGNDYAEKQAESDHNDRVKWVEGELAKAEKKRADFFEGVLAVHKDPNDEAPEWKGWLLVMEDHYGGRASLLKTFDSDTELREYVDANKVYRETHTTPEKFGAGDYVRPDYALWQVGAVYELIDCQKITFKTGLVLLGPVAPEPPKVEA